MLNLTNKIVLNHTRWKRNHLADSSKLELMLDDNDNTDDDYNKLI